MDFNPLNAYKATLEQPEFDLISKFIGRTYGIKLPSHKRIMLQGRLISRLIKLNYTNFKEYTDFAFSERGKQVELPHMVDVISTNKTDFYREAVHFEFLKNIVVPEFMRNSNSRILKVWSAACSSGEEVYTIAMELDKIFSNTNVSYNFSILGTDISNRMLEQAKKAIYLSTYVKPINQETKQAYLLKSKDKNKNEVRIKKKLRDKVRFKWHNLMDQEYDINEDFDIIFCRNVLIYFTKQDQLHVLQNLTKRLKPGGYLFLGHSESITHFSLPLINVSQTVFQKQY